MINIGKYIETAINWLTENFAPSFRRHQCWNRRVHRWVPKHIDVDTFLCNNSIAGHPGLV